MAALNRTGLHTEPRHEAIAATLLRVGTLATSSQLSILWADLYPSTHAAPHRAALRCSKSTVAASILSMTLLRTTVQVTATPSFIDLRVPWRDPFRTSSCPMLSHASEAPRTLSGRRFRLLTVHGLF